MNDLWPLLTRPGSESRVLRSSCPSVLTSLHLEFGLRILVRLRESMFGIWMATGTLT